MVHHHCEDRVPPCKAQIESGSYVTMSRNKVVKKLRDLDSLSQFLLDKVMYSFVVIVVDNPCPVAGLDGPIFHLFFQCIWYYHVYIHTQLIKELVYNLLARTPPPAPV